MAVPRGTASLRRGGTPTAVSRKARRQQERLDKKSRRATHAARGHAPAVLAPAVPAKPGPNARRPAHTPASDSTAAAAAPARKPQARAGAGGGGSNFHRLIQEQGLADTRGGRTAAERRLADPGLDDLDAEIEALEKKLGMGKKQTAERERRAFEKEGLGFALDLTTDRNALLSRRAPTAAARSGARRAGRSGDSDEEEEERGGAPVRRARAVGSSTDGSESDGEDDGEEAASGEEASGEEASDEEMTLEQALGILDGTGSDFSDDSGEEEVDEEQEGEEEAGSEEEEGEEEMTLEEAFDILEGKGGSESGSEADEEEEEGEEDADEDAGEEASDQESGSGEDGSSGGSEEEAEEEAEAGEAERAAKRSRGPTDAGASTVPATAAAAGAAARAKYIPPALRAKAGAGAPESAATIALRRALRSAVNRVSAENVTSVTAEVLRACAGASRAQVAELLCDALFSAALSDALVLGPLVLACAALAASLHLRLGMAVGARVAEALVRKFDELYAARRAKACVNGALLLAHLYNFKVVHCGLVYDLVRKMAAGLGAPPAHATGAAAAAVADGAAPAGELQIEVLHALLRAVGTELRADDPAALKEIVLEIGRSASAGGGALAATVSGARGLVGTSADALRAGAGGAAGSEAAGSGADASGGGGDASVRMQVLLQLVLDLKNNKLKARGRDAADETVARVRRALLGRAPAHGAGGGAGGGSGGGQGSRAAKKRGREPAAATGAAELEALAEQSMLRASWADYAAAATKGRWWLVGSAWAGAADADRARAGGGDGDGGGEEADERVGGALAGADAELLALARRQGMNTEVRRAVFGAIMGADGHVDACERIARLKLKHKAAQREVARVLVECCAQEAAYNPFYAQLALRLCAASSDTSYTLQYAYWDHFKQLPSYSVRRISHLARLLASLLGAGALPLAALKGIEFGAMHAHLVLLLQVTLLTLVGEHDERALNAALGKLCATKSEGAAAVVEGLYLFCGAPLQKALETRPRAEREACAARVRLLRERLEVAASLARVRVP